MAKNSVVGLVALIVWFSLGAAGGEKAKAPVKVSIEWDKDEHRETEAPFDPTPRIQARATAISFALNVVDDMNKRLDQAHAPVFKIDGVVVQASSAITPDGRAELRIEKLPKKGGRERSGYAKVWRRGDLQITQTVEMVPGRSTGEPRKTQMDAVLVHYVIENLGKAAHSVGVRTLIDQRYAKLVSPAQPGKALDGVELKAGALPAYLHAQPQDMKKVKTKLATNANVYIALATGGGERPDRVVISSAPRGALNEWEMPIMAGGTLLAAGLYWGPKDIPPGGKRELVYGYGTGVASASHGDVSYKVDLGGSFEIGKTFTLSALISDPYEGQTLELELPKGLQLIEGKAIQPVPTSLGETSASMILWKGRVMEYGRFPIRIHSNAGTTRTMIVTVGPA